MTLSLIIPAYNEGGRIGGTITHVCDYLDRQAYDWEVIVVVDGGPQDTATEARAAAAARASVAVSCGPPSTTTITSQSYAWRSR